MVALGARVVQALRDISKLPPRLEPISGAALLAAWFASQMAADQPVQTLAVQPGYSLHFIQELIVSFAIGLEVLPLDLMQMLETLIVVEGSSTAMFPSATFSFE